MPKLPIISAADLIKVLVKLGYEIKSQRGSHIKLIKYTQIGRRIITVPNHKFIRKGTLKNVMRYLNLDTQSLIDLLKNNIK